MPVKTITAAQQRRDAQIFNMLSCAAILLMPLVIPALLWIAASIFVHASIAHHPNQRVRDYLYPGGYRFYGLVGALVVGLNFSPQMSKAVGGGIRLLFLVWLVSVLVVVPLAVRDILRARKENWQDITVETPHE
ncbi:MAG TPA: hypothetical protein VGK14_00835 [Novimethylophilus sp.]|jgi:hypothetical protein|uniref:hypothetical protein n=1 Tax=Novimethylophilus sp. TaxID=2137426 RepID=UPI002F4079DB